jgi:GNAT superfamily N-acetyltransferase
MASARIELLDLPADPGYQRMTFPYYRSRLESPSPETLALAAREDGEPVGLALTQIDSSRDAATLDSLFVVPEKRERGIAAALIERLEDELRGRGCARIGAAFATSGSSVAALERLAERFAWSPPTPRSLTIKVPQREIIGREETRHMTELGPPFSIGLWSEVTAEEREQIRRSQQESPWIPPELDPFRNERGADLRTSLAVRHGTEVVGWLINHELDPETSRATCAWVREDLQRTPTGGRPLMALSAEAGPRRLAIGQRYVVWVVHFNQPKMVKFTERVWGPHAISKHHTMYTEKML